MIYSLINSSTTTYATAIIVLLCFSVVFSFMAKTQIVYVFMQRVVKKLKNRSKNAELGVGSVDLKIHGIEIKEVLLAHVV